MTDPTLTGTLVTKENYVFFSKFAVKDKVTIDGCKELIGVVTGVMFKEKHTLYEVSWFHNGQDLNKFIEEYRLELAP